MNKSPERPITISIFVAALLFAIGMLLYFLFFRLPEETNPVVLEKAGGKIQESSSLVGVDDSTRVLHESKKKSVVDDVSEEVPSTKGEPLGPISIQGIVHDSDQQGIEGVSIVALNANDWNSVITEAQTKAENRRDPRESFKYLNTAFQKRMQDFTKTKSVEHGKYFLRGLVAGDYRLLVSHENFLPNSQTWALVEEGIKTNANVELVKGYSISGQVVDEKGHGVENAVIHATRSSLGSQKGIGKMMTMMMDMVEGNMASNDGPPKCAENGHFTIRSLEPVSYDIRVTQSGYVESRVPRIPVGTENVVVVLSMGNRILGRVLDPKLQPVEDAKWILQPAVKGRNNPMQWMQTDIDFRGEKIRQGKSAEDGKIKITGLKKGSYSLTLEVEDFPVSEYEISVSEKENDIGDLVLETPFSITGEVQDPEGNSVAGSRVWIKKQENESNLLITFGLSKALIETTSDEDGNFMLEPIASGSYEVHARTDGFAETSIEVEAGSTMVVVQLSTGLSFAGLVLDKETSKPIEGVSVIANGQTTLVVKSDEEGYFELNGMSAKNRYIGMEGHRFLSFQHPNYSQENTSVTIQKDKKDPTQEFLLSRKTKVFGHVLDGEGNPVRRARVGLKIPGMPEALTMMSGSDGISARCFSDKDGSFQIDVPKINFGPMSDKLEIVASHPAFASGHYELGNAATSMEGIEIVLTPGVVIEGKVIDSSGEVVEGVQFHLIRVIELPEEAKIFKAMMPKTTGRKAYSNSRGHYNFQGVESGNYSLDALAIGFAKTQISPIEIGDTSLVQDVILNAGGTLTGLVVGTMGQPLEDIEVVAFLEYDQVQNENEDNNLKFMRRMVGRGNANDLTNKEGRYDLTHLPEGEFTLVARADGYETTEVVSVKSGQRVPDLILGRFSSIKVVAEASDTGLPVLNYKIQLKKNLEDGEKRNPFDRRFEAKTIENEEGEYIQEGLGKGRYQLELVSRGYRHVSREVLLKGDEDYTEVIKMEPGFILEILAVRKDTMDPIEGVEVKYRMLQDDNSKSIEQPTLNVEYRTGQDGLAVLDSLSEGQYSISVTHPYYINETDLVNMEFPRDTDRQLKCEFSPAGIVKGKFNNISEENFQSVDYKLEFYTLDGKGKQKVPDESANPSEETWDYNLWVDPTRGTINQESMRVGNYKLLLKRKTYQIEEGQRVDSEPVHASFQMGELEIRPGETHDLNLMVPE